MKKEPKAFSTVDTCGLNFTILEVMPYLDLDSQIFVLKIRSKSMLSLFGNANFPKTCPSHIKIFASEQSVSEHLSVQGLRNILLMVSSSGKFAFVCYSTLFFI